MISSRRLIQKTSADPVGLFIAVTEFVKDTDKYFCKCIPFVGFQRKNVIFKNVCFYRQRFSNKNELSPRIGFYCMLYHLFNIR